ncbi:MULTISPECIES: NAD-dependent epimerase/dehydratase family protein [Ralstonia]|uniref:Nucleoside-diphosphate-sugar epimerase n=1 Tax=Ralstonia pickettii OR214 TaxID=1264675 RepID=R0CR31_RALPI|nr:MULTISPECIES: NAD-dependent epimerase/dehydratase family protein [Ralstonia]ENZ79071.1 nucleoside-diphosphate-sugar epimerase [Ralstonia pickettii OR214]MBL4778695.1 NAD-dependent epimerase/dehydratase family protein [Ralstonia sp.]MCM3580653.1 NAD-dependent epimerase/dehydratase family protein [Ralstonia pickettii]MDR9385698.1 NAD-dependent epimerase/dehydratase family protein [Ralstonia sp. 11b]OYU22922.1 MAG: epimerase [Ralstonia sp. PBBBR1]
MKILVTGATGKIGSRLVRDLTRRGYQVRALVRDRLHAAQLEGDHVEVAEGDLLDADSLAAAVPGTDVVVHCAAFFRGATVEQAYSTNDLGTRSLAAAARAASVNRFIFMSTGLVYGPTRGLTASEVDPCAPTMAYPMSKLAAERFLLGLDDLDVRVLRLAFVYGDGDPHVQELIPLMQGWPANQRMSVVHHADVAQAVVRVLEASALSHRIYNVVDDEAPTIAELFASVGAEPPNGSTPERAADFDTLLEGRRVREDLDFKPKFSRFADALSAHAL